MEHHEVSVNTKPLGGPEHSKEDRLTILLKKSSFPGERSLRLWNKPQMKVKNEREWAESGPQPSDSPWSGLEQTPLKQC